ncbi:MAG: hypothetical protein AAFO04_27635 [Cyanobacteria bacterium J06592_8]
MVYIEVVEANQTTIGSDGNDQIFGTSGRDGLVGKAGDDLLIGNAGNDNLYGLEGNDSLFGSDGNDYLQGGDGYDILTGGSGADTFDLLYNEAKTGSYTTGAWFWKKTHYYTYFDDHDVIKDFNAAEGDQVLVYQFEMSNNVGDFSANVHGQNTHLGFKGATFAVLEGVTNFDLNNDLEINWG